MAKPRLGEIETLIESTLIAWMKDGLEKWRPDLDYPESYSDMQACARGIMSGLRELSKSENVKTGWRGL